jgi:5-methylcytosine-specific restriction endonuclease McrA
VDAYYITNSDRLKANAKIWREKNPERKKANDASWVERNREHKNELDRIRWHADPERSRQAHHDWYMRNKHVAKEAWHRRRALKRANGYERVDLEALLAEHGMFCHICTTPIATRKDLHFDHVIPLSKGGPHTAANLRPAHAKCNLSKGSKILTH